MSPRPRPARDRHPLAACAAHRVNIRTLFFLRFGIRWRGLLGGLTRPARLDDFRLEEGLRRRYGRLGGFFAFLADDSDVLAAGEPLSLVCVARDADVDCHFDFGMQRNRHLVQSGRLDRRVKRDLSATDGKALLRDQRRQVAGGDRAVKLTALGRLAQHREALTVELLRNFFRFSFLREVARFELDFHLLEARAVVPGRAQRFALRQEIVAREAVLDAYNVARLAELGDALKQDYFHGCLSIY